MYHTENPQHLLKYIGITWYLIYQINGMINFSQFDQCEWKKGYVINLTESNLAVWSDHKYLTENFIVGGHTPGTLFLVFSKGLSLT